jgi:hypothetical protein
LSEHGAFDGKVTTRRIGNQSVEIKVKIPRGIPGFHINVGYRERIRPFGVPCLPDPAGNNADAVVRQMPPEVFINAAGMHLGVVVNE